MIVRETAEVRKQINNYKRFLEKPELFNHAAQLNDQFYYNVQYWRMGKNEAVGYLILRSDGSVPPRSEALPVVHLFMSHNTYVINFTRNFAIDKEKPVWMYEQKRDCLQQLLGSYQPLMDTQTHRDAVNLIEVCEYMVDSRKRMREIFDEGMRRHSQMVSRNFVTEEDVLPIYQALHESDFLAYTGLRKQVEIHESADRLYSFFTSVHAPLDHEQKKALGTLIDLLQDYKRKEIRRTMEQSLRSMEVKGGPYRSAEEMRQALDEKNQEIFRQKLFPILRNP